MRKVALVLALVGLTITGYDVGSVKAQSAHCDQKTFWISVTGNELQTHLTGSSSYDKAFVDGYLAGVTESYSLYTSTSAQNIQRRYALGKGVMSTQVRQVVSNYLAKHPEQWHGPAVLLIEEALAEAFPCSKNAK
jgi:hypothetical protein